MPIRQNTAERAALQVVVRGLGTWFDVRVGGLWVASGPTREAALATARAALTDAVSEIADLLDEED